MAAADGRRIGWGISLYSQSGFSASLAGMCLVFSSVHMFLLLLPNLITKGPYQSWVGGDTVTSSRPPLATYHRPGPD